MSFDLELIFRESIEGNAGEVIADKTVFVGDRFFVEIRLGDFRKNSAGIITTSLDIEFESEILQNVNQPFNPPDIITEKMPIFPTGELEKETGEITNLGAGSLPSNDIGSAIGVDEFEQFALLEFEAETASNLSTIDVQVDLNQTGFADGEVPASETQSNYSLDFIVGGLEIDDATFLTGEGLVNGKTVGMLDVKSVNPDELEFEIIAGNQDQNGNSRVPFRVRNTGEILINDRADLTQDFDLTITVTDHNLELQDSANITIQVIPLPFFGTSENNFLTTIQTREIAFLGQGEDEINPTTETGRNRIYGGTENDLLIAGDRDRVFGNFGDDTFIIHPTGNNNRLYGGNGDDHFFFTRSNLIFGGNGIDRFFAGEEGGSTLYGGSNPDLFWIFNGVFPNSTNIINDFTLGEDIIGLAGVEADTDFQDLELAQQDGNTLISLQQEIAILKGIESSDLRENNFTFLEDSFVQPTTNNPSDLVF